MGEAEGLVRAMEERGTKSNVVVYNTLLRGYARSGQTQVGNTASLTMFPFRLVAL